jgi:hypothetical protein
MLNRRLMSRVDATRKSTTMYTPVRDKFFLVDRCSTRRRADLADSSQKRDQR